MSEGWRRTTTVGQLRAEMEGLADEVRVVIRIDDQDNDLVCYSDVRDVDRATTDDTGEDQPEGGDLPILLITTEARLSDDDDDDDEESEPE